MSAVHVPAGPLPSSILLWDADDLGDPFGVTLDAHEPAHRLPAALGTMPSRSRRSWSLATDQVANDGQADQLCGHRRAAG
jgi:hypothetical protein